MTEEQRQIRAIVRTWSWIWYLGWVGAIAVVAWERPLLGGVLALLAAGQFFLFWSLDGLDHWVKRLLKIEEDIDGRFGRVRDALDQEANDASRRAAQVEDRVAAIESRLGMRDGHVE